MNLVMISPGYPAEMAYFTRALAAVGATVIGLGDQPPSALPEPARNAVAHYEQVNLADEGGVLAALHGLAQHISIEAVECLWEPYMILAARIRESFGLPGMTVEETLPFRDKEQMKTKIDSAGIRTPWHVSAATVGEGSGGGWVTPHRQADRRSRLGRHLPRGLRRGACRGVAVAQARSRGQRRGVHRRRSSPTTPCAQEARSCTRTSCGTGRARYR